MTYYPVVIPTLNRFQHFKECVESLSACTYADKTELIIGLDYPPSEKYIEGWNLIKEYLPTIKGFGKVTIFEHKHNLGPFDNANFLRDYVFNYYDAYIYTEDDNIFSPCFLDYMNKCLEKYKSDQSVAMISGCLEPDIKSLIYKKNNSSILKLIGSSSAYGMGLWASKEKTLIQKFPNDLRKYIFNSRYKMLKLLKCPAKLNHIYFWIKRDPKLNCICDFTRNAWMVLNNQSCILPTVSLVKNMGFDGSGLHCGEQKDLQSLWNKMELCSDSEYNIIDNYTKKEIHKDSKKIFKAVPKSEIKEILPVFILYFIFGFNISQILLKFRKKIINVKKNIKEKLKTIYLKGLLIKFSEIPLKEQKEILISILDWTMDFCKKNNIRCYLHAGTLLGAVRHKGFIPWDDDVDVAMPRPDYEKFLQLMENIKCDFYIANYKNIKYYPTPFSKICKKDTEAVINQKLCCYGLGIDVFPIDGFPQNLSDREKWFSEQKSIFFDLYLSNVQFELYGNKNPVKFLYKKIKNIFCNSNKAAKRIDENAKKNDFESSYYAGCSVGIFRGKPEIAKRENFDYGIDMEFEGKKYLVPVGWKDILTSIYGSNFMIPPPEDKRQTTHDEIYYKRKQ